MGNFLDQAADLWMKGVLHARAAAPFYLDRYQHGGQETTCSRSSPNLPHVGWAIRRLNYGFGGPMKLDEASAARPMARPSAGGRRQPTAHRERAGSERYKGRGCGAAKKLQGESCRVAKPEGCANARTSVPTISKRHSVKNGGTAQVRLCTLRRFTFFA